MKTNIIRQQILSGFALVALMGSVPCHSESQPQGEVTYTFLKECKDKTNNANAAFNELSCPDVEGYRVEVSEQLPIYFNIRLIKGDKELSSDFTAVTNENPVEPGKAIEWRLYDNKSRFMIFRLSWGTQEQPFDMKQYLVINLITEDEICVIDKVEVGKVSNANQVARDLIENKYRNLSHCPTY